MGLKTVEAVGPCGMCAPEPVVHRGQALKLESRRAALAVAGPTDEAGPLQDLEVLGDGRLRQRGGLCELDHASIAGRQALQDPPFWAYSGREYGKQLSRPVVRLSGPTAQRRVPRGVGHSW